MLIIGTLVTCVGALVSVAAGTPSGPLDSGVRRGAAGSVATVDLDARVKEFTSRLSERGGYRPPSAEDRASFADGLDALLDGDLTRATALLDATGYRVRELRDAPSGRRFTELADASPSRERARGWGRYYLPADTPLRWSVQVPHPVADRHTERLGVVGVRGSQGGALLLAGAHRRSGEGNTADVAHRTDTLFHAAAERLVAREVPAVQLHGFAPGSAPGRDAVVSTGRGDHGRAEARALATALERRGLSVCRAWTHRCPLAGRTNVQGRAADDAGLPFLHLELAPGPREPGSEAARRTARVLAEVTDRWARG
ncbi:hypothetical protein [Streptomyces sp. BBFR102]|uniref:hypothetical protein n=1 Tax=Streptomyces sp. BBFR102 TaxID=3448171 RepID=UPI003F537F87